MTNQDRFTLKETANGSYRLLIDGQVHPLLCGLAGVKHAIDRLQEQLHITISPSDIVRHRFNLGERYLFMAEKFTTPASQRGQSVYLPWQDGEVTVQLVALECISQHKVPGEWDDEIQYKGYRFKLVGTNTDLPLDTIFDNQYPRASYGQLTTSADYYARIDYQSLEQLTDYEQYGFGTLRRFEDTSVALERTVRGIEDFKAIGDQPKAVVRRVTDVTIRREDFDMAQQLVERIVTASFHVDGQVGADMVKPSYDVKAYEAYFNTPIESLDLPVRTENVLRHIGNIERIGQLVQLELSAVLRLKYMGAVGMRHIDQALKSRGLHLGMKF